MGKFLGSHESEELDRPDLNKCPDCRCFFDGDNCPLCGKECPEEMRAGNRAKVKPSRSRPNPNAGRVTFIAWYHTWLCIILCLITMPILGIILLCTSPYRTRTKILVIVCILAGSLLLTFVIPVATHLLFLQYLNQSEAPLADTSLNAEEYAEKCTEISAEAFYRNAENYEKEYLTMEIRILSRVTDVQNATDTYSTYYICEDASNPSVQILIRDCILSGSHNFVPGDKVRFYGEGAGNNSVTDSEWVVTSLPCLNAAYAILID